MLFLKTINKYTDSRKKPELIFPSVVDLSGVQRQWIFGTLLQVSFLIDRVHTQQILFLYIDKWSASQIDVLQIIDKFTNEKQQRLFFILCCFSGSLIFCVLITLYKNMTMNYMFGQRNKIIHSVVRTQEETQALPTRCEMPHLPNSQYF